MERTRAIDAALWVSSILCIVVTLSLSLVAHPRGARALAGMDKFQHFVAYLITSSVLYLAAVWRPGRGAGIGARRSGAIAVALLAVAGVVEVVQGWVGRNADVLDWLAGAAGIGVAFGALSSLRRRSAPSAV